MSGLRQRKRRIIAKLRRIFETSATADKVNYRHGQNSSTCDIKILNRAVGSFRLGGFSEGITWMRICAISQMKQCTIKRVEGRFPERFVFQIALPNDNNIPSLTLEFFFNFSIALNVAFDFLVSKNPRCFLAVGNIYASSG